MSETLYEKIGRVMSILQSISEHANAILHHADPPDSIVIIDLVRQIRCLAHRAEDELRDCQDMADRLVRSKLQ